MMIDRGQITDEGDLFMALRVSEFPQPFVSSSKHTCESCQQDVWVARSAMPLTRGVPILCVACAREVIDNRSSS